MHLGWGIGMIGFIRGRETRANVFVLSRCGSCYDVI